MILNIPADRSDEYIVESQRGSSEVGRGTVVAIALSGQDGASRLIEGLSLAGFDVTAAPSIGGIADVVDDAYPFVAILDDTESCWLRDVADLVHLHPEALPLALVDIASPAEVLAAINAGVAGFVSPLADTDAIARTVQALFDSGVAIPRPLVPTLLAELRGGRSRSVRTDSGPIDVTDREWEILQLMLQRRSTREIAEMLFVSVGTVRSHISALGRKLGASDRAQTIRLLEQRRG